MEESSYGLLSLATPLAAVVLALRTRQVYLSLLFGIVLGQVIVAWEGRGLLALLVGVRASVELCVTTLADVDNARVILFVTLVGSVLLLAQRTGGVEAFVNLMTRRGVGTTRRGAELFTFFVGLAVFVETSISCLVSGAVGRPLCDRARVPREKLAFLCDTTSAPVCTLLLFNAWGALILGLLGKCGLEDGQGVSVLLGSIAFNFYAWGILALALFTALTGLEFGPMARARERAAREGKLVADGARPLVGEAITSAGLEQGATPRVRYFLVPLLVMLAMMPSGLYLTGLERAEPGLGAFEVMMRGSGSTAVLWAVLAALTSAVLLARIGRVLKIGESLELAVQGAGGLASMAVLMILAFAIGATCKQLGTGLYVKSLLEAHLSGLWLAPLLFAASCVVSFSTGTSWGTLSIMIPIGVPAALGLEVSPALATAAVLSGSVFGDHCSPISDTTLISSMASACDHVDHVKTQLPYALLAAGIAVGGFFIAG